MFIKKNKKGIKIFFITVLIFLMSSDFTSAIEIVNYNFVDVTISNDGVSPYPIAIEHDSDIFPWTKSSEQNDSASPKNKEYVRIYADNTSEWRTDDPKKNDEMAITFRFFIQQIIADISNVQIKWNGNTDGNTASNHSMWLRKDGFNEFGGTNTWVQLGNSLSIIQDVDTNFIRDLTNDFSTYINQTTGQFEFVVTTDNDSEDMRTNYIELSVEYDTAPEVISNLSALSPGLTTINLTWTAPGDDITTGTATTYDIRYSTTNITNDTDFNNATSVIGEPTPSVAGTSEAMTVTGLTEGTIYYFAIKTSDEVPNTSSLSNTASGTTTLTPDTIPPSNISDLTTSSPTSSTVNLTWTAPGDDGNIGTATTYDIRYSTTNITNDTDFSNATSVTGEPNPSIAGTLESMTVNGLTPDTTYYFTVKTSDEASNISGLSNTTTRRTPVYIDTGGGSVSPTKIIFSGKAFPGSKIEVLFKSDLNPIYYNSPFSTYNMSDNGEFFIEYIGFLTGNYFLTLKAIDKTGEETGNLSFNINFREKDSLVVENIIIPPTIIFDHAYIKVGDVLKIYGYSYPNSEIELDIDGDKYLAQADNVGFYSLDLNIDKSLIGINYVKSRQVIDKTESSTSSSPKAFKVSKLKYPKADFDENDYINIIDWSIFLFRWNEGGENIKKSIDLDDNGEIDIFDFSIFLKAFNII